MKALLRNRKLAKRISKEIETLKHNQKITEEHIKKYGKLASTHRKQEDYITALKLKIDMQRKLRHIKSQIIVLEKMLTG